MRTSFTGLFQGLIFAILLVYLLIVVNFQSWLDPFIIITALPAALAGIVLCLFFTRTTLSVPALMGAIMCMGVATANSILVVSFAKDRLVESRRSGGGRTGRREHPLPAGTDDRACHDYRYASDGVGMGEGGEQNAPLGRAVIGGLLVATVATLIFVPAVFSLLHGRRPPRPSDSADSGIDSGREMTSDERNSRSKAARKQPPRRRGCPRVLLALLLVW